MTNLTSANTGEWGKLLTEFKTLIEKDPPPDAIKDQLEALKLKATNSAELTYHQKEGIIARVSNYLNGSYGNTKTQANLDYGKPTTPPQK